MPKLESRLKTNKYHLLSQSSSREGLSGKLPNNLVLPRSRTVGEQLLISPYILMRWKLTYDRPAKILSFIFRQVVLACAATRYIHRARYKDYGQESRAL